MDLSTLERLDITIEHEAPLADFTTFRLGGTCPTLLTCQTPKQLEKVVRFFSENDQEFIIIGLGSNLVASDEGLTCYVIRYVSESPIIKRDGNDLIVSGSTLLDDLVGCAHEYGLEGLNEMSGIPGTVAGAVLGNAGAFGRQVGDVVSTVYSLDKNGNEKEISAAQAGFSYRHSDLKDDRAIVVSVRVSLELGDKIALQQRREEILKLRWEKHPDMKAYPCAGSFFRNIEPTSKAGKREAAGWFLEEAGALGLFSGGAKVFEQHANMIYKSQGCCAQDVFDLSLKMAQAVKAKFDLDLVREVSFVGKFDGMPKDIDGIVW